MTYTRLRELEVEAYEKMCLFHVEVCEICCGIGVERALNLPEDIGQSMSIIQGPSLLRPMKIEACVCPTCSTPWNSVWLHRPPLSAMATFGVNDIISAIETGYFRERK